MARIGGRNIPIAALAGVAIIGVVGGLVVLAAPLLPPTVDWTVDTLQRSGVWLVETTRDGLVALTPRP